MANAEYHHIVTEIRSLDLSDQLRLLEDMASIIRNNAPLKKRRSILELQGNGKEIWRDVDVKQFIDKERDSWNG